MQYIVTRRHFLSACHSGSSLHVTASACSNVGSASSRLVSAIGDCSFCFSSIISVLVVTKRRRGGKRLIALDIADRKLVSALAVVFNLFPFVIATNHFMPSHGVEGHGLSSCCCCLLTLAEGSSIDIDEAARFCSDRSRIACDRRECFGHSITLQFILCILEDWTYC